MPSTEQRSSDTNATVKDAQIKLRKEEYALGMGQRRKHEIASMGLSRGSLSKDVAFIQQVVREPVLEFACEEYFNQNLVGNFCYLIHLEPP